MKIYTKIRIDLKTGKTIEEESFEYDGPLALCWDSDGEDGNDGSSSPGGGDGGDNDAGYGSGYGGFNSSVDSAEAAATAGYGGGDGGWGEAADYLSGAYVVSDPLTGAGATAVAPEPSEWDKFKGAVAEIGSYLKMGAKAVVGIGALSAGAVPVGAAMLASLAKDLYEKDWSTSKVVSEIAKQTGVSQTQVSEVINSPDFQRFSEGNSSEEIGAALSAQGVANPASAPGGWTAAIQSEGWGGSMTDQLGNLLTASTPDMTAFNSAMDEFRNVNTDIKFVHDMSGLEGVTLSAEEKGFLETMRLNATTNLTNTVNESTMDLAETEIARLVSKGVLQGNIGSETMAKIYENAGRVVGEQSRNIESDVAKMGLGVLEQKKLNTMNLWGKELEADIASATTGTDKWKSVGMLELGKAEQGQKWNQSLIDALTTMRGQDTSFAAAKLGASTNLNLASQEMRAWKDAQDKQLWGNIGSALISAWGGT